MKNIVKKLFLLSVVLTLSIFPGCSKKVIKSDDKLKSIYISCSHMNYYESYNINVYIENSKPMIEGDCSINEDYRAIIDDEKEISKEDFDKLNALCNSLDPSLLKKEKKRSPKIFIYDETIYSFHVYWDNGNEINRSKIPEGTGNDIKEFLFELMEKYSDTISDNYA